MKLIIWDGIANEFYQEIEGDYDNWYWEEGNGSCDCNRVKDGDAETMLLGEEGICYGCQRFVIVEVDDDLPTYEMNSEYDQAMVVKSLIAHWRRKGSRKG